MKPLKRVFSKKNRALLTELVRTDFKLRYQGSALGYAWSVLRPLLLFAILYLVFVRFLKIGSDIPHYPIYLLLGVIFWTFFSDMTTQSLGSVVNRGDLIRKISIPRWVIVLSSSILALINLALNLLVLGVFMALNHNALHVSILVLPLLLLELYVFGLGIALFLSAAFVKFRDVSYIWEVVLQAGFYVVPILYPLSMIHNTTLQKLMLMNPVAQIIQDARYMTVSRETITLHSLLGQSWLVLVPFVVVFIVFLLGLQYFRSQQDSFAENL